MVNLSELSGYTESSIPENEIQFPNVIWRSGDPTRKPKKGQAPDMDYMGGFFIAKSDIADDLSELGWVEESFVATDENNQQVEIEGWYRRDAELMLVNRRRRWVTSEGAFPWTASKDAKAAQNRSGGSMKGHYQFIVMFRDMLDYGPFCWGCYNHTQMAMTGLRSGSYDYSGVSPVRQHVAKVLAPANKEAGKQLPLYVAWMRIQASQNEDGTPLFATVGVKPNTSDIVLPHGNYADIDDSNWKSLLTVQENDHSAWIKALEVDQMLAAEGWLTAWDSFERSEQKPASNNGTAPQPQPSIAQAEEAVAEYGL